MTKVKMMRLLKTSPVIAAVKTWEGLQQCLQADNLVCFVVFGDVCSIEEIVDQIKEAGKMVIVHLDLIDGLAASDKAVDFIASRTKADGIISTRPQLIRYANTKGLITIQRLFILDSIALQKISKQKHQQFPDFYEILPGLMPKVIREISDTTQKPIIAGGLIIEKDDILAALNAGAVAVSSTNPQTWCH